ncbi:Phosphatidylethanolamine N-methyltransferase [Thioalkalivibrio nitratireducens DSM 14787]|uniref:Phosphatidylethanolamine N-methyltransferase n=2 Tax=Thioalkalivibrio nitratireducens TaxID=186931 RepID=L0DUA8_THIND|nr:Phosphatidylethanolamine N-methyltransferase [Thioalkalivibrio nitratireducens DSM 14787]
MGLNPGHRVLEVGIGTGLSLSAYPRGVEVVGIDIAPQMLDKARRRAARSLLEPRPELRVMDARKLELADASFDSVVAMYVVSVTPEPERVVAEMVRVCRPGGAVVIVNHFRTESRLIRWAEVALRPLHRLVNYSAELDREDFLRRTGLQVVWSARANVLGYSTVLYCRREPVSEPASEVDPTRVTAATD